MFGLDAQLPVHADYIVGELNNRQIVAFLEAEKVAFVNDKMTYSSIKDPMKRAYMEFFTTWVLHVETRISSLLALNLR